MELFSSSPLYNVMLFTVFWGLQLFVAKLGFNAGAEIFSFAVQTSIITLIFLAVLVLPRKYKLIKKIPLSIFLLLLFANAIHAGLGSIFINTGIKSTSAINIGFLSQFSTVSTTLFAWLFLNEQLTKTKIVSVCTIILGTFFLVTKGQFITPHFGDIFILLACVCWSTGNVLVRRILKQTKVDADLISFFRPVAALPVLFAIITFFSYTPMHKFFTVHIFTVHILPYAALNGFLVAIMWLFLNKTLKIASASYMTMMSSLTPVIVALLAIIFLKETINSIQLIGAVLIISSSFISQILRFDKH